MTVTTGKEINGSENVVKTNVCPVIKQECPSDQSKGSPDTKKNPVQSTKTAMKDNPLKKVSQLKPGLISQTFASITKSSAPKQILLGTVTGWTTGYLTMKVGRTAAFAVGGGILIFQIAQHTGHVKMDWDKVKEKVEEKSKQLNTKFKYVEKAPLWKANALKFARGNTYFAAGFVGGFLIGLAS